MSVDGWICELVDIYDVHAYNAIGWMLRKFMKQRLEPDPYIVKTALWRTIGLHLFFILCPIEWLRHSTSTPLLRSHLICKTTFGSKFKKKFTELFEMNRETLYTRLVLFLSEVYQEVEEISQSELIETINSLKVVIKEIIAKSPKVLVVPDFGTYTERDALTKQATELEKRVSKLSHQLDLGDCEYVRAVLCSQVLRWTGSDILSDIFLTILGSYQKDRQDVLKGWLRQEASTFYMLLVAWKFRQQVELECQRRYHFKDRLYWFWSDEQLWREAADPVCGRIAQECEIKVGENDAQSSQHSESAGLQGLRFPEGTVGRVGSVETNVILALRERSPPLSHREIALVWTDGRTWRTVYNTEQRAKEQAGLAEAYSPDNNRHDLRTFSYPPMAGSWPIQKIEQHVQALEENEAAKANEERME